MTGPKPHRTPPGIITLVSLAGLSALSMNVFLPSLPGMARYYDVDYGVMQFSVSGYLAMSALLQLFVGPVSDRFGRRPVMIGTLLIFLLATVGTDRVLFGSDYPFRLGDMKGILARVDALPPAQRDAVRGLNAIREFRLQT